MTPSLDQPQCSGGRIVSWQRIGSNARYTSEIWKFDVDGGVHAPEEENRVRSRTRRPSFKRREVSHGGRGSRRLVDERRGEDAFRVLEDYRVICKFDLFA